MRLYFLSHSSKDKDLVRAVAEALGPNKAWLDEWELTHGERLFKSIDAALGEAKIVAVFWSQYAAASPWVDEEASFARFRMLQGEDVKVVPVLLDSSPLPNWMGRLLYIDGTLSADHIAGRLRAAIPESDATRLPVEDTSFQDRIAEADEIEAAYTAPDCACVLIMAPPGIGKTSLLRRVMESRLPHLRAISLDLEALNTPALVFAALAGRLGLQLPQDVLQDGTWEAYWASFVLPALDLRRDVLVLDGLQAIAERGELPDWCSRILRDAAAITAANQLPLVCTAAASVEIPAKMESGVRRMSLGSLADEDIVRLIRHRLSTSYPRRQVSAEQLHQASRIAQGYPLAAHLWAAHATQVGVELALRDKSTVERRLRAVVSDIVSQARLSDDEITALAVVGLMRIPTPLPELIDDVGISAETLTALHRTCLFDPRSEGVALHGLVAKYLVENVAPHKVVKDAHRRLGLYFKQRWKGIDEFTPTGVISASQAYYHLVSAGLTSEAQAIHWALLDEARAAARELYRVGDYQTLIALGDAVPGFDGRQLVDDPQLAFYVGLALGRRDEPGDRDRCKAVLGELVTRYPHNRHYLTGFADILARWNEIEPAKELYHKARAIAGRNDPIPSARLGELLLRQEDLKGAEFFLNEARTRAPDDLRILASVAQLMDAKGQTEEALALVRAGLRARPDDIPLNHRAGVLLKRLDRTREAIDHFKRAATGRTSPASYTSLADLYLGLGEVDAAERLIRAFPGRFDSSCFNVLGHIARRRQEYSEAEKNFRRCREMDGSSVVVHGSFAQLYLDQAAMELSYGFVEPARAHLMQAEDAVLSGLELENDNTVLLHLKRQAEGIRIKLLKKPSQDLK